jgi:subtilisin family serine protease
MSLDELFTHRRSTGVLVKLSSTKPADLVSLGALFDDQAGSGGAALGASLSRRRRKAGAAPMLVFEKLGVAYGAATRDGWRAMLAHKAVAGVAEANGMRMIRPVPYTGLAAAAMSEKPDPGPTWGIRALKVDALWAQGLSGNGVLVGHLDTGVDAAHPMLAGAIAKAVVFDLSGLEHKAEATPTDSADHGTHTAGTIAGRPCNGIQAGVAPGAKLLSAEVIEGGDSVARVLGGLDWVLRQGARVLSMSLGWPSWTDSFLMIVDALRANECLPVMAVGNDGEGSTRSPGNYAQSLCVGAVGPTGRIPMFSGSEVMQRARDPIVPDIVAPGVDVWSAAPGGGYQMMQGTSMATPHVAGLAALLMEAAPSATIDQIEAAIFASSHLNGFMQESRAGRGMPDGVAALQALKATT